MFPPQLSGLDILCGLSAHRRVMWMATGSFSTTSDLIPSSRRTICEPIAQTFRTEIPLNPDDLSNIFVHLPNAKSWLNVPLQRPLFNDGCGLSLVQLQIIRGELKGRLDASECLRRNERAIPQLRDRWEQAARRGLRLRRDASLIRMQGLTLAPLDTTPRLLPATAEPPMLKPALSCTVPCPRSCRFPHFLWRMTSI